MAKKFLLIEKVLSYNSKAEPTQVDPYLLISPSQNVLIDDKKKVKTREGYTLYGATSADLYGIESQYDWNNSSGDEINIRCLNDEIQFYDDNSEAWITLKDSFTAVDFCFATWWDTSEKKDLLLFVNGSDKIWDWSGAITTLASVTTNTITKNGTTTWAQERFLTSGTRQVVINGTTYTYTGGETTTTLTGVTPDPSGEAANSTVFQAVRENDNEPADGVANDIIAVSDNQLWILSNTSREVYVSKNTDFKDFSFSSPRIQGEGDLIVLDDIARAFIPREGARYISAGKDYWYRHEFKVIELSSGSVAEISEIKPIKTAAGQAAQSQDLTCLMGDVIAFIDFNNILRILGNIENLENQAIQSISDPVKSDFDTENFTGGQLKFHKNRLYISAPANGKVYITETRQRDDGEIERFWQPPQILPIGKFMVRNNEIYGHSADVSETYQLFTGTNDNGKSMKAIAAFAYRNYNRRDVLKVFDEWLTEGYITSNTKLTLKLNYDFGGGGQQLEKIIDGADDSILYKPIITASLGDEELGDNPLGDQTESIPLGSKFRIINEFPKEDFFEIQCIYETDTIDVSWEILSHGGNIQLSTNQPISLKQ